MFNIILYLIITLAVSLLLREFFVSQIGEKQGHALYLTDELKRSNHSNEQLNLENSLLTQKLEDTLALYELTKDICRSLDEEKVFAIFKQNLDKHLGPGDYRYIKNSSDLIKYTNYTVLPLKLEGDQIAGYLAVDRILETDKEKFGILVQQFMIGLRRALLYQKVQALTIMDVLTGVYCRRYFLERFSEELKRAKKNKLALAFLMIDIDNFKQFNDRYGHLVGDAILRQVSKTIRDAVRQIDFIGRYGGEEIVVILAETGRDQANFAAERIRQAITAEVIRVYDEEIRVTVSIGVANFPDNALNMQNLIELADQALYLAKETGKNRVCFSPA